MSTKQEFRFYWLNMGAFKCCRLLADAYILCYFSLLTSTPHISLNGMRKMFFLLNGYLKMYANNFYLTNDSNGIQPA